MTHSLPSGGDRLGMGLKPLDQWPHTPPVGPSAPSPSPEAQPHLAHRHAEDAGIQQAGGRVGAHLTHEGEPLPPPHAVLLHLLPAGQTGEHERAGQYRYQGQDRPSGRG